MCMKIKLTNTYRKLLVIHLVHILAFSHPFFPMIIIILTILLSKSKKTPFFLSSHGIRVLRYRQNDIYTVSPMAYGSHVLVWAVSVH